MGEFSDRHGGPTLAAGHANGSYEDFVRLHFHPLEKSLSLITLDAGLAADAAQEAFLRLYLRWDEVDRLDDPVAWLYRVGINRCHDYRRQIKRATRLFDRLSAQADPDEAGEQWVPGAEFAGLVKRLPKQQRVAAVLFYQADLSTKEIARTMQISESAVKSHLQRAREALRPLVEVE
jgi:RNA polymerase sigma factor (sigma-70 family)